MYKHITTVAALLVVISVYASDQPPGVIADFCAKQFKGDIAEMGQPFNATDIVKEGVPTRRILGYFVTSTASFLWYEHGGRGYHQHLIRFSTAKPEKIEASYVFIKPSHGNIEQLIKDTEFLRTHVAKHDEL